jgi:hypothetical protein
MISKQGQDLPIRMVDVCVHIPLIATMITFSTMATIFAGMLYYKYKRNETADEFLDWLLVQFIVCAVSSICVALYAIQQYLVYSDKCERMNKLINEQLDKACASYQQV